MAATCALIQSSCKWLEVQNTLYERPSEQLGCSDKGWNMIALSPQVHDWWHRGLFAFKCIGMIDGELLPRIHLQSLDGPRVEESRSAA